MWSIDRTTTTTKKNEIKLSESLPWLVRRFLDRCLRTEMCRRVHQPLLPNLYWIIVTKWSNYEMTARLYSAFIQRRLQTSKESCYFCFCRSRCCTLTNSNSHFIFPRTVCLSYIYIVSQHAQRRRSKFFSYIFFFCWTFLSSTRVMQTPRNGLVYS